MARTQQQVPATLRIYLPIDPSPLILPHWDMDTVLVNVDTIEYQFSRERPEEKLRFLGRLVTKTGRPRGHGPFHEAKPTPLQLDHYLHLGRDEATRVADTIRDRFSA